VLIFCSGVSFNPKNEKKCCLERKLAIQYTQQHALENKFWTCKPTSTAVQGIVLVQEMNTGSKEVIIDVEPDTLFFTVN